MVAEKEVRLNVRLEKEKRDIFQGICKAKAVNASELMRQWVDEYIEKSKKEYEAMKEAQEDLKRQEAEGKKIVIEIDPEQMPYPKALRNLVPKQLYTKTKKENK